MDAWFAVNWYELFVPSNSILELFIRGSIVYLLLFFVLRFIPTRQLGMLGITDLLVVVLFAEAAQNAMATTYTSITEGVALVGTVIFWSYIINWLGYKFPLLQKFLNPPPLLLVKNGRLIERNLAKELITEEEIMSQLRQQGIELLKEVKIAYMEADGGISVIPHNSKKDNIAEK
ncbi:DUF421 domain-containing protein [Aliterella atlantica]|uniref:Membrane protein n=1 Tax=Aliterella atlantica CENA595 TaxID=1618023 RepID=A0A0D8ZQG6_9CYAN|nr:YetF domain-containing protein [Aliterella atlantica]KJH70980.1 membrane protein [Aliterella atlantica CENA595]